MKLPYMSLTEVAKELHISRKMASKARDGIRELIPERYPPAAIAWRKVNVYAVIDYLTNKDLFDMGVKPRYPFNPAEIAWICGYEKSPTAERAVRQKGKINTTVL